MGKAIVLSATFKLMDSHKKLSDIIQILKDFEVVACDLVHEKVALNKKVPRVIDVGGDEKFERKGLCKYDKRKQRLGCAHTNANTDFLNFLKEIDHLKPNIRTDVESLENIILQIYLLDHHKGELEKKKAECYLHNDHLNIQQCEEELKNAINRHRSLIQNLDGLKTQIIRKLEE